MPPTPTIPPPVDVHARRRLKLAEARERHASHAARRRLARVAAELDRIAAVVGPDAALEELADAAHRAALRLDPDK